MEVNHWLPHRPSTKSLGSHIIRLPTRCIGRSPSQMPLLYSHPSKKSWVYHLLSGEKRRRPRSPPYYSQPSSYIINPYNLLSFWELHDQNTNLWNRKTHVNFLRSSSRIETADTSCRILSREQISRVQVKFASR